MKTHIKGIIMHLVIVIFITSFSVGFWVCMYLITKAVGEMVGLS